MRFDLVDTERNPALDALSRRYAEAMDRRDRVALLSVFDTDASMLVEQPGRKPGTLRGHTELGRLVKIVARWPRTLHVVDEGLFTVEGPSAAGEVGCTAHHFDSHDEGAGRDHIMHIVYRDQYRRAHNERWYITHRHVIVTTTEDRPAP